MPRAAWFFDSLIETIYGSSQAHSAQLGPSNVWTPRPREPFAAKRGGAGGNFDIAADNKYIDVDIGAGTVTATLTEGSYTGQALAGELESQLKTLDAGFAVWWSGANFSISWTASFSILGKTGPHGTDNADDSILREIGVSLDGSAPGGGDPEDRSGSGSYGGVERYHTHSWLILRNDSSPLSSPDVLGALLFGDDDTDFTDIEIYGHSSLLLPATRATWSAGAAFSSPLSTRAGGDKLENPIQIADLTGTGATLYPWWYVSWRHLDVSGDHRIGWLRFAAAVQSATRTVRQLRRHGIRDLSDALGVDRYYPARRPQHWAFPVGFEDWGIADWRTVGHKLCRWGKDRPYLWALNWQDLVAGSVTAQAEAERGYLGLFAAQDLPEDDYGGEASAVVTAEYSHRQVT